MIVWAGNSGPVLRSPDGCFDDYGRFDELHPAVKIQEMRLKARLGHVQSKGAFGNIGLVV